MVIFFMLLKDEVLPVQRHLQAVNMGNREMLTGCSTMKEIINLLEIVIFNITHTAPSIT